jgi:hypothetical protein
MSANLPASVLERIKEPFQKILSTENFGEPVNDIAELIGKGELTVETMQTVLNRYKLKDISQLKPEVLFMLLSYTWLVISDNVITASEAENFRFLKRFFKIKEGDFYSMKRKDIERILE